ncbi:MAG: formate dehydrogenase accessory sulfurtransferase FdhD [Pseudomonadota bacterium]|nr:formate dehydrogenase accessory sulfurtransferase FdhD [Pseudomonadota bacterium]
MAADPEIEPAALVSVAVHKWRGGEVLSGTDIVAEEVPVALVYNGISHVVMMASPGDLDDFALGFSLTEGILQSPSELFDCELVQRDDGIEVQLQIASERFLALKDKRRNLTGRTGCGLCGAETLQQAIRTPAPVHSHAAFSATQLRAGMAAMQARQVLQQQTGATHAAAFMHHSGQLGPVREDVGRHNALDKLIGALARDGVELSRGAVLVTSRASYEMVQKTASMGVGVLAAISAPTSLAIRMAERAQLTLVGFMRERAHVVYTHAQRVLHDLP